MLTSTLMCSFGTDVRDQPTRVSNNALLMVIVLIAETILWASYLHFPASLHVRQNYSQRQSASLRDVVATLKGNQRH